jgi:hypothetical protein
LNSRPGRFATRVSAEKEVGRNVCRHVGG